MVIMRKALREGFYISHREALLKMIVKYKKDAPFVRS